MQYRLIIKGGYGLTNFGDDALLYTLSSKLKPFFRFNDIAFACYESKYNHLYTNGFNIIDIKKFKIVETSFLVYGGGTQFYNFRKPPYPLRVILSKIKKLLLNKKNVQIHNSKKNYQYLGAIGIGIGPFLNDYKHEKENNIKEECKNMSFLSVRDTFSKSKCKEWGIVNFTHDADICYAIDDDHFDKINTSEKIKNIGIIVRDWEHTENEKIYYTKIKQLKSKLEKGGFNITLILFAVKSDNYWNTKKKEYKNVLEWNPSAMNIKSFTNELSSYDLFITARYHGAVFSSLLGIPFISIIVEQKLSLISEIYKNCSEQWKFPFDVEYCIKKIDYINQNYALYCKNIKKTTEKQKKLSNKMFNNFINFCQTKKLTRDNK